MAQSARQPALLLRDWFRSISFKATGTGQEHNKAGPAATGKEPAENPGSTLPPLIG